MSSSLTPGIVFLLIAVICILLPGVLVCTQPPNLAPIHRRRKLQFWSAALSGLPMVSILTWNSLGIPPSHASLAVGVLFAVAIGMPVVAMGIIRCLFVRGPTEIMLIFLGFI